MSTEILSDEVRRKLYDLYCVVDAVKDTVDSVFRLPLDYDDSIPEGIVERDKLIQKLKDGLYEANMIMGQIKP
jgi:nitrogen-specific signal transduction histidine kinase